MSKDNNDVVIIELDRPRELRFTHTSLKTLVALTGKTIEEIDTSMDISEFEFIEAMVYCGLLKGAKENGETLELEKIPELLDEAPTYIHSFEKVRSAWLRAFGTAEPTSEGNQPVPVEQPGKEKPTTGKKASK